MRLSAVSVGGQSSPHGIKKKKCLRRLQKGRVMETARHDELIVVQLAAGKLPAQRRHPHSKHHQLTRLSGYHDATVTDEKNRDGCFLLRIQITFFPPDDIKVNMNNIVRQEKNAQSEIKVLKSLMDTALHLLHLLILHVSGEEEELTTSPR